MRRALHEIGPAPVAAGLRCSCRCCAAPLPPMDRADFTGEAIVRYVLGLLERAAIESEHLGMPEIAASHRLRALDLQVALGADERLRGPVG